MTETAQGHAELVEEGLGILTNLMDNIQRKGNYSAESTVVFLDQIGQCLRAALRPDEAAGLTDHKWLDPECGVNGCQSLVWEARYKAAVNGRREFRAAYRAVRHAYVPDPEYPQFCKQCGYAEHVELQHVAPDEAAGQGEADENDGLEHCGNFSATDPITDEDRIDYWKGAYERMAARNIELCKAGKAILGHMPEFYPDNSWQHFEEMLTTGGGALP